MSTYQVISDEILVIKMLYANSFVLILIVLYANSNYFILL